NSYNDFFAFVLPCVLIFSIWINDTMAYVVGSLIGRTPLSSISPKKTWEGTAGGAILAVVVVAITTAALDMDWKHCAIIAAIAAIAGTIGDLFESKLKRLAGVKDSGSFMPGHGGFLDRFDSLLVATPFVALYVYLFM
ncbi:MAG: phosphatidate cytidylyltransferase, partial [Chitinophagaceae bacterium]|nr:phosphatidate cytidylyltransferase [Chitinophagaceae bacterium]